MTQSQPASASLTGAATDLRATRLAVAMIIAVTTLLFSAGLYAPIFSNDSWAYLELSSTVFRDFYRYNTLRQFEFHVDYSNAFPPLWPVLIALLRQIVDLGIYTGYLLNYFICLGLLFSLVKLCRRLGMAGSVGAAAYACLLLLPRFVDETLGARALPLSIWLLTMTLWPLVRSNLRPIDAALAGALMGLNCLVRFDMMLAALVTGGILAARACQSNGRFASAAIIAICYFGAMVIILSPWMAYNARHFGRPFASDNTRQVMMAQPGDIKQYYEVPPEPDLTRHPMEWLRGLVTGKIPIAIHFLATGIYDSPFPVLLLLVVFTWGTRPPELSPESVRFIKTGLVLIPFLVLPSVLVGYGDSRYFTTTFLLAIVILLILLHWQTREVWRRSQILLPLAVAVTSLLYSRVAKTVIAHRADLFHPYTAMAPLSATPEMQQISEAVKRDSEGRPHRLLHTKVASHAMYGALTGEPTSIMPRLTGGSFAAFARDWEITHVYDPENALANVDKTGVELVPLDLPDLYRLKLTEPAQPKQ